MLKFEPILSSTTIPPGKHHRVLPTAQRLFQSTVWHTEMCHHCNQPETLEHLLLECTALDPFNLLLQQLFSTLFNNTIQLNNKSFILGLQHNKTNSTPTKMDASLFTYLVTIAKFSIHSSAVKFRLYREQIAPNAIFTSIIKSHIFDRFRLASLNGTIDHFQSIWCRNDTLASIRNNKLIFNI